MTDLLMILLLGVAFAGAFGYIRVCGRVVDAGPAPDDEPT